MSKQQTLLVLTPGFPKDEQDINCMPFPQSCLKNMKLADPSLQVIVCTFQYPYADVTYEWHGIKVFPFNGQNKKRFSRLMLWKRVWQRLKLIFTQYPVTGILSLWLGECALLGKHAAKKYHVKHFTWLLGQDARKRNRFIKWINPEASSLIALSDSISDELYKNYKIRPPHIIPAGIDASIFPERTHERNIDILGAGSLIPLKQYDVFISTITTLVKKFPDIQAIICGDGPEREHLQKLITEHTLHKNIKLLGDVAHADVLTMMQTSRIFLHPSAYEGFSTACNEALYAGAHVVTFCKPMNKVFDHLHIVATTEQVIEKLSELLTKNILHDRVLTYPIAETCEKLRSLYD